MLNQKKIIVVMPAYNAASTLEEIYQEIPHHIVDEVILVDDQSHDNTTEVARKLGIKHIIVHEKNTGYGGNQKSCYKAALSLGADIVIMVHPDYQYTPKLCESMASLLAEEVFNCVLGSRILGKGLPTNFAPHYPYFINIGENINLKAFVPMFGVLGLTLASLFAWTKGRHAWLIAWLFYLVTLSPILGLIQVGQQGAADRYAYLPTLPVYFLLGAGILAFSNKASILRKAFEAALKLCCKKPECIEPHFMSTFCPGYIELSCQLLGEGRILRPYHSMSLQFRHLGVESPAATKVGGGKSEPGLDSFSQTNKPLVGLVKPCNPATDCQQQMLLCYPSE